MDVPFSIFLTYINATANDPKASVSGTGEKQLAIGENIFTITVTAEDGVTKLDYTVTVTRADEVGILENTLTEIRIYPNPTTGELRIESVKLRVEDIAVFDIYGRAQKVEVRKQRAKGKFLMDISNLPTGVYFLWIRTEQGEVVRKVLKE